MPQGGDYTEMSEFEWPMMFIWVVKSKLCEPRWQEKTNPSKLWSVDPHLVSFTTCRSALIKEQGNSPHKRISPAASCQSSCHTECALLLGPGNKEAIVFLVPALGALRRGKRPRTFCTPHMPTWSPDCTLGDSPAPQVRTWKLFSCAHPPNPESLRSLTSQLLQPLPPPTCKSSS